MVEESPLIQWPLIIRMQSIQTVDKSYLPSCCFHSSSITGPGPPGAIPRGGARHEFIDHDMLLVSRGREIYWQWLSKVFGASRGT